MPEDISAPFEFKAIVSDVVLTDEAVIRVSKALETAVMAEVALIDNAGDIAARSLPTAREFGEHGGTAGIAVGRD